MCKTIVSRETIHILPFAVGLWNNRCREKRGAPLDIRAVCKTVIFYGKVPKNGRYSSFCFAPVIYACFLRLLNIVIVNVTKCRLSQV